MNNPLLSKLPFEALEIKNLSGLSNENYLISIQEKEYVLRIPRQSTNKFIDRDNEAYNTEIAQQLGIAPNCLWRGEGDQEGTSITEFIKNTKPIESDNQEAIDAFAKTLINLHHSKKLFKNTLDNKNIATRLKQYFELCPTNQKNSLKTDYSKALSLLETSLCNRPTVPSHIDLITENILLQGGELWFIDWEYSAMASPFWDIAIFCNSADLDSIKSEKLLKQVLTNCQKTDLQCFKHYRFITKTVSRCWCSAFES